MSATTTTTTFCFDCGNAPCACNDPEYLAYNAYLDSIADQCGVELVLGSIDPYGTACDQGIHHGGRHEADNPLGSGRVSWSGGGFCAGDQLPVSNITFNA